MLTNRHWSEHGSDFTQKCVNKIHLVPQCSLDYRRRRPKYGCVWVSCWWVSVCLQKNWMKLPNNQRVTNRFKCVGRAREIKGNEAMGISAYTEWVVSVIGLKEEGWRRERQDKTNQEAKWGSARALWKKRNKGRTVHTWWRKIMVTQKRSFRDYIEKLPYNWTLS